MKIILDPVACDGFGYCVEILPEVLRFDEWGFPVVAEGEVPDKVLPRRPPGRRVLSPPCPRPPGYERLSLGSLLEA